MKTKRIFLVLMALTMVLWLGACAAANNTANTQSVEFKVMGDAFAVESEDVSYSYDEDHFVYLFNMDGTYMRVASDLTEDIRSQLDAVDIEADDVDDQILAIIAPLEVSQTLNLSEGMLSSDELKQMAGRPAEDLIGEGYTCSGYVNDSGTVEFYLDKGCYTYMVTVKDETIKEKFSEDGEIDITSTFRSLTIKEMTFDCLNETATDYEV